MTFQRTGLAGALLVLWSGILGFQGVTIATTTAETLNVRESPGGEVIDQLPRGTRVAIIDTRDGWAAITYFSRGEATDFSRGEATDAGSGWVSVQYLRRASGGTPYGYGSECESEDRSGAEVCLNVSDASLDCDESYLGDYYDSCDVAISYRLETNHRGQSDIEVDVSCNAEISYERRDRYGSTSDYSSNWFSHDLGAHDSEYGSMNLHFSFSSFDEVVSAEIESVDCRIEDLELY